LKTRVTYASIMLCTRKTHL